MLSPFLGRTYSREEIDLALNKFDGIEARWSEEYLTETAQLLSQGEIVGWFQGGSEIGPRALGNRSILADPRDKDMKDRLNHRVKFRESFRPFAPAVLWEHQQEYFDLDVPTPYMLMVADIFPNKRNVIPAVTHVDGTGRLQTVMKDIHQRFYQLIEKFYFITGVPVVLNTSFNVKGEPIVETPEDALRCFQNTNFDYLIIDKYVISKVKSRGDCNGVR
ncbi:MAG TPA: carbamoyltransferase C-terminal domain-containing protein [Ruminiclostridium sp.]|nr:carbamoyltransferase C-terminal domain-containing protein [Ruminiclostridium sp.]